MPEPKSPAGNADKPTESVPSQPAADAAKRPKPAAAVEIGGPTGPEPTRYGDWERNGRCTDF